MDIVLGIMSLSSDWDRISKRDRGEIGRTNLSMSTDDRKWEIFRNHC
jgi:hypothetical protein